MFKFTKPMAEAAMLDVEALQAMQNYLEDFRKRGLHQKLTLAPSELREGKLLTLVKVNMDNVLRCHATVLYDKPYVIADAILLKFTEIHSNELYRIKLAVKLYPDNEPLEVTYTLQNINKKPSFHNWQNTAYNYESISLYLR